MMTVRRRRRSAQAAAGLSAAESISVCPVCFGKIRATDEICPHCGAVRYFGATPKETLLYAGAGCLAGLALAFGLRTGLALGIFTVLFAMSLGFLVVHSKYGDRWIAMTPVAKDEKK